MLFGLLSRELQDHARCHISMLEPVEDLVDGRGCSSTSALTLPSVAKASASAISWRVPTNEPQMVRQFATTSNRGEPLSEAFAQRGIDRDQAEVLVVCRSPQKHAAYAARAFSRNTR
jgi:hypothetical protein